MLNKAFEQYAQSTASSDTNGGEYDTYTGGLGTVVVNVAVATAVAHSCSVSDALVTQ